MEPLDQAEVEDSLGQVLKFWELNVRNGLVDEALASDTRASQGSAVNRKMRELNHPRFTTDEIRRLLVGAISEAFDDRANLADETKQEAIDSWLPWAVTLLQLDGKVVSPVAAITGVTDGHDVSTERIDGLPQLAESLGPEDIGLLVHVLPNNSAGLHESRQKRHQSARIDDEHSWLPRVVESAVTAVAVAMLALVAISELKDMVG